MWAYSQASGSLYAPNGKIYSGGYSGYGPCKNNPDAQDVCSYGPIPRGIYDIKDPIDSPEMGDFVLPLEPRPENQMFGRRGFFIHGDSIEHPGEASRGCMIFDRDTRERIASSADKVLAVF